MCIFVVSMKRINTIIILCFILLPVIASKHEVRAVWLTTLGGLDWPHTYAHDGMGIEQQKRELCDILDKYVEAGLNTVLFQSRVRGTTVYPSTIEPWEASLSGNVGVSPGYDALEFAIKECHKRGLKIHAWVVAIPLGKWNGGGCVNIRRNNASLVKRIGDEGFMNPEKRGTADYIAGICREIVRKYDVDGIHLDYIRYPDTWGKINNKNAARNNITRIVETVYEAVKKEKAWVALSCSPVGKYADTKRAWAHGWNARDVVCQDVAQWLQKGLMDMVFPMMYFKGDNFFPFLIDWKERSNGRIMVPGLGIYFMHPSEKNWPLIDIAREMQVSRSQNMGVCFFRSKFFTDNTKGLFDFTKNIYSRELTIQPPMTWVSSGVPQTPVNLKLAKNNDGKVELSWDAVQGNVLYNIYGSIEENVDIKKPENLLMAYYEKTSIELPAVNRIKYFAVTAIDRFSEESLPVYSNMGMEEEDRQGVAPSGMLLLMHDNTTLYLDDTEVQDGDLIELCSMTGVSLTSRFVYKKGEHNTIDISALPMRHYKVYVLSPKGNKHLLGYFCNIVIYK